MKGINCFRVMSVGNNIEDIESSNIINVGFNMSAYFESHQKGKSAKIYVKIIRIESRIIKSFEKTKVQILRNIYEI